MMQIIKHDIGIDFIGKRKTWAIVSFCLIATSFVLLLTKGLNFGIDFTGGAVIQVQFQETSNTGQVREWLSDKGIDFSVIQRIGNETENEFQLKLKGEAKNLQKLSNDVEAAFTAAVGAGKFEIRKVDVVGPAAGKALRSSSFWAGLYALIGILIYIMIRFDFRYSPGAIVALVHDSILILGVFVLTQHEFSLQIVAALLTIIGYSINDTIIVYDRIRETVDANPKRELEKNINISINSTLGRTLVTSVTTLLAVAALWSFGGGIIRDFAEALFIGVVVGTYSSVFVASPVFLTMARRQERLDMEHKLA